MSVELSRKKTLPLWRRIALGLILLAIIGLAGKMLAGNLIQRGLDNKLSAIEKSGYPVSFEQLASSGDTAAANGAAELYRSALNNLTNANKEDLTKILAAYRNAIAMEALEKLPKELTPGIASILDQHQSCLNALDKAAELPLNQFDMGIQNGKDACVQKLNQIQKALTISSLRTMFLLGAKQDDLSARSIIAMLKAIRIFDTTPTILLSRTKQHFVRLACDDIRLLLSHGRPSDKMLDEIATALKDVLDPTAIKETLLAEQVYQIEASRNLFSKKAANDYLSDNVSDMPERASLPGTTLGKIKLRWFVLRYLDAMGDLIAVCSKASPELLEYVSGKKEIRSGKLKLAIGPVDSYIETSIETIALVRITRLALAVERYRRSEGRIPDSLKALPDNIEAAVVTDPCSGQPLLYTHNDISYTLYSTGLDRIDQGGATQAQISPATGQVEKKADDLGLRILLFNP